LANRIGNPGCNDTKSAFADCGVGGRALGGQPFGRDDGTRAAKAVSRRRGCAGESAKADFASFEPGFPTR